MRSAPEHWSLPCSISSETGRPSIGRPTENRRRAEFRDQQPGNRREFHPDNGSTLPGTIVPGQRLTIADTFAELRQHGGRNDPGQFRTPQRTQTLFEFPKGFLPRSGRGLPRRLPLDSGTWKDTPSWTAYSTPGLPRAACASSSAAGPSSLRMVAATCGWRNHRKIEPDAAKLRQEAAVEQIRAPAQKARESAIDSPQFRQGITQSCRAAIGLALIGQESRSRPRGRADPGRGGQKPRPPVRRTGLRRGARVLAISWPERKYIAEALDLPRTIRPRSTRTVWGSCSAGRTILMSHQRSAARWLPRRRIAHQTANNRSTRRVCVKSTSYRGWRANQARTWLPLMRRYCHDQPVPRRQHCRS